MRFVAWNLWVGNTGAKLLRLPTTPEVAVLGEVSEQPPAPTFTVDGPEWLWEGEFADRLERCSCLEQSADLPDPESIAW